MEERAGTSQEGVREEGISEGEGSRASENGTRGTRWVRKKHISWDKRKY